MSGNKPATLFLLILAACYAVLFYHAEMGINLLVFDALLIITALRCRPELAKNRSFIWSVGGMLFAAGCVVIVHGEGALWAHHLSYILVLGFAQARELRFLAYGFLLGLITLARGPLQWYREKALYWREVRGQHPGTKIARLIKFAGPVVFIVVPFVFFYLGGSQELAANFGGALDWLGELSMDAPLWSLTLFIFGALLVVGLLFPRMAVSRLSVHQEQFSDEMGRKPKTGLSPAAYKRIKANERQGPGIPPGSMLALKDEYRQAVLTFGLLNALLLLVNLTDLTYVWIKSEELSAATLSHYVHFGTGHLSFSILLAITVVLWFFRGNLNFLPGDRYLRPLVRIWLAQNAVLALSVGVRNYHYIDAYGLALGRVYIGFFLLAILIGLFTLLRKVNRRLTFSYLVQSNSLAVWLLLLAFGAVNWPGVITRYNLATQTAEEVDWDYLRWKLDRRNTFLLLGTDPNLEMHSKNLVGTHERADWRSWNYADWRNERVLRESFFAGRPGE